MEDEKKSPGLVPLSRDETHEKILQMFSEQQRGRLLDVPTGTGVLADRLHHSSVWAFCLEKEEGIIPIG